MIKKLKQDIRNIITSYYEYDVSNLDLQFPYTKQEFEGDITLVIFPLLKISTKSLKITGEELGNIICSKIEFVVKLLNLL